MTVARRSPPRYGPKYAELRCLLSYLFSGSSLFMHQNTMFYPRTCFIREPHVLSENRIIALLTEKNGWESCPRRKEARQESRCGPSFFFLHCSCSCFTLLPSVLVSLHCFQFRVRFYFFFLNCSFVHFFSSLPLPNCWLLLHIYSQPSCHSFTSGSDDDDDDDDDEKDQGSGTGPFN